MAGVHPLTEHQRYCEISQTRYSTKNPVFGVSAVFSLNSSSERGYSWAAIGKSWATYAQNNNPMTLPELPICQAFPAANQIADSVLEMLLNMVKIEGHDMPNADAVLGRGH
jgi:hypothetical protein